MCSGIAVLLVPCSVSNEDIKTVVLSLPVNRRMEGGQTYINQGDRLKFYLEVYEFC